MNQEKTPRILHKNSREIRSKATLPAISTHLSQDHASSSNQTSSNLPHHSSRTMTAKELRHNNTQALRILQKSYAYSKNNLTTSDQTRALVHTQPELTSNVLPNSLNIMTREESKKYNKNALWFLRRDYKQNVLRASLNQTVELVNTAPEQHHPVGLVRTPFVGLVHTPYEPHPKPLLINTLLQDLRAEAEASILDFRLKLTINKLQQKKN